jgi:hypothetical protein
VTKGFKLADTHDQREQHQKTDAAISGGQISSTHLISGKNSNMTLDA